MKLFVHKLAAYSVADGLLELFKNYLNNHRQNVIFEVECFSWTEVFSGIPQESVLGRLYFVVYINNLPESEDGISKLFADDSK